MKSCSYSRFSFLKSYFLPAGLLHKQFLFLNTIIFSLLLQWLLSTRRNCCYWTLQKVKHFLNEITRFKWKSTTFQDFRLLLINLFSPDLGPVKTKNLVCVQSSISSAAQSCSSRFSITPVLHRVTWAYQSSIATVLLEASSHRGILKHRGRSTINCIQKHFLIIIPQYYFTA